MTREEYIKAILRGTGFDRKTKQRVKADLESDIGARLDAGEDMDAVVAAMGSPEEVAGSLAVSMGGTVMRKNPWRWVFFGFSMLMLALMLFSMVYWQLFGGILSERLNMTDGGGAASIGIIGGADGPTAIYGTTQVRNVGVTGMESLGLVLGSLATFLLMQWKGVDGKKAGRFLAMGIALLALAAVLLAGGLSGSMLENLLARHTLPGVMLTRLVNPAFLWPLITGIFSLHRWRKVRRKGEPQPK